MVHANLDHGMNFSKNKQISSSLAGPQWRHCTNNDRTLALTFGNGIYAWIKKFDKTIFQIFSCFRGTFIQTFYYLFIFFKSAELETRPPLRSPGQWASDYLKPHSRVIQLVAWGPKTALRRHNGGFSIIDKKIKAFFSVRTPAASDRIKNGSYTSFRNVCAPFTHAQYALCAHCFRK